MAPRYCPIDGRPWGTCTSADYVPPLEPRPAGTEPDDEIDRKRIVPSPLDPRVPTVFVNRPAQLPAE